MPGSFDGANFRQDKEKGAENTLCIVKPFDAVLAEIGPSKPCSYWRHQASPKRFPGTARRFRPPLPVADEAKPEFPQPRHWRAVAKQAREWHCGKVFPAPAAGGRKSEAAISAAAPVPAVGTAISRPRKAAFVPRTPGRIRVMSATQVAQHASTITKNKEEMRCRIPSRAYCKIQKNAKTLAVA